MSHAIDLPSPATQPPPRWWEALALIAVYFLLQVAVGAIVGRSIVAFDNLMVDSGSTGLAPALRLPTVVVLTLMLATAMVMALVRWRWSAWLDAGRLPGLGFVRASDRFLVTAAGLGFVVPIVGGILTSWLAHGQDLGQTITEIGRGTPFGARVVLLLVVVSVGPLVEETLFRGVFLGALSRHMSSAFAITTSAVLFAMVHLPDLHGAAYALPNLFLLGWVCGWLRVRSGSIWPAVLAHGANNLIAAGAWFVATHQP